MDRKFYTVADVAEMLQITTAAVRNLINSGELQAFQVGGRGLWRIEDCMLNAYIKDALRSSQERLRAEAKAQDASLYD